jgi:aspartate/methionine/tyrosine aminotransferase
VAVFKHLNRLREKARRIVDEDRKLLRDFLVQQSGLSAVWTDWGTTSFVQLLNGNTDEFLERLRTEFDTSVVPGRFFEMPDYFRIGMGVNTEMFGEGLDRISQAMTNR